MFPSTGVYASANKIVYTWRHYESGIYLQYAYTHMSEPYKAHNLSFHILKFMCGIWVRPTL